MPTVGYGRHTFYAPDSWSMENIESMIKSLEEGDRQLMNDKIFRDAGSPDKIIAFRNQRLIVPDVRECLMERLFKEKPRLLDKGKRVSRKYVERSFDLPLNQLRNNRQDLYQNLLHYITFKVKQDLKTCSAWEWFEVEVGDDGHRRRAMEITVKCMLVD